MRYHPPPSLPSHIPVIRGEWDHEGVYVYQAYRDAIADWALEHQRFGGPAWNPTRMTWIKPSFAWMLYRSGYGCKPGQTRVLKLKLPHARFAELLAHCRLAHHRTHPPQPKVVTVAMHREQPPTTSRSGGSGRVQWDPERDLWDVDGKQPRKMLRTRAIQIGLAGDVSQLYVDSILSIQEVTDLAHRVATAHRFKSKDDRMAALRALQPDLPVERPYMPQLPDSVLTSLALLPGSEADFVSSIGRQGIAQDY